MKPESFVFWRPRAVDLAVYKEHAIFFVCPSEPPRHSFSNFLFTTLFFLCPELDSQNVYDHTRTGIRFSCFCSTYHYLLRHSQYVLLILWRAWFSNWHRSLASSASAQRSTHSVTVGANGLLAFNPTNITAAVNDIVRFEFHPKNHSVAQSDFGTPCAPLLNSTGTQGFVSGL